MENSSDIFKGDLNIQLGVHSLHLKDAVCPSLSSVCPVSSLPQHVSKDMDYGLEVRRLYTVVGLSPGLTLGIQQGFDAAIALWILHRLIATLTFLAQEGRTVAILA